MIKQRTLREPVSAVGVGVHSGKKIRLTLRPAPVNTGLVFTRTDLNPPVVIQSEPSRVNDTRMATTLDKDGARIATIEHMMSAFSGLAIDNCFIDVDAPEIPIMDGSGSTFVYMIQSAGLLNRMLRVVLYAYSNPLKYVKATNGPLWFLTKATNFRSALILVTRRLTRPLSLLRLTSISRVMCVTFRTPARLVL